MCVVWEKGVVSERSTEFGGPKNVNFLRISLCPTFIAITWDIRIFVLLLPPLVLRLPKLKGLCLSLWLGQAQGLNKDDRATELSCTNVDKWQDDSLSFCGGDQYNGCQSLQHLPTKGIYMNQNDNTMSHDHHMT